MIILIGPSGAGKSTLLDRALKVFSQLKDTTTFTTRSMRPGESEGHPYHFVTKEKFEDLIAQQFFVEWAPVHTNLYGTPYYQLEDAWRSGQTIIMDVDVQGAQTFQKKYPHAETIFILPPSIDVLRQRLASRDQKPAPDLEVRLKNAQKEMALATTFRHQIINDDIDKAFASLQKIIEEVVKRR